MWMNITRCDDGESMILNTDHIVSIKRESCGKKAVIEMTNETMILTQESYDAVINSMMNKAKGQWI